MSNLITTSFCDPALSEGRNGSLMTAARLLTKKSQSDDRSSAAPAASGQSAEVIRQIKSELERTGSEAYFIGKRVEDALAQVYFSNSF